MKDTEQDWKIVRKSKEPKYLWLWVGIVGFIGYAFGRVGSILWGHLNIMHHWIPALVIIVVSPVIRKKHWWWVLVLAFGIGFLISDFSDFIHLRVWGADMGEQHFWGID